MWAAGHSTAPGNRQQCSRELPRGPGCPPDKPPFLWQATTLQATLLLQPGNDPALRCAGFAQPAPGRRHLPRCAGTHAPSRARPGTSYRSCTIFKGLAWMGTPGSAWPCSHQDLRGRRRWKGFELSWKGLTHSGIRLLTKAGFREPGNGLKPTTCRNIPHTSASYFLRACSSITAGALRSHNCTLCSVVSGYRGQHHAGSRERQLLRTAPTASSASTCHRCSGRKQLQQCKARAGPCPPLQPSAVTPPAQHTSSCCMAGAGRELFSRGGWGKHPCRAAPSKAWPARRCGGTFQGKEWHRCCHQAHRNQVYLFNLKEKIQLQQ